jgi:hypothetical protein
MIGPPGNVTMVMVGLAPDQLDNRIADRELDDSAVLIESGLWRSTHAHAQPESSLRPRLSADKASR